MKLSICDIKKHLHIVRGVQVMLDRDVANLFRVETRVLNQAVRRNPKRFPLDFAFELTRMEFDAIQDDRLASKVWERKSHGGARYLPLAFTECGVLTVSSVLRNRHAAILNAELMRMIYRA